MKKIFFSVVALVSFSAMAQQSFAGFRNGYYSGTHAVLSNPASIAASPRTWDVNLFSTSINVGTDKVNIDLKNLEKSFQKFANIDTYNDFSGNLTLDVLAPSFMFALNNKHSIALTTRVRAFVGVNNLNAKLFDGIIGDISKQQAQVVPIEINNQNVRVNAFSEIGATWAGVLFDKDGHLVKAGATAKYVRGTMNTYADINKINAVLTMDPIQKEAVLNNTNGELTVVNSGISLKNFKASDLTQSKTNGVGLDIGAVYEYAPEYDKPYRFKVGMAITDIGSLKYTPIKDEAYHYAFRHARIKISENIQEELNQNNAERREIGAYKVSLPTAFQAHVDYHIHAGIFVELAGQFGLTKGKIQNPYYNNDITLTPRFERRAFGVYVPITYNSLAKTSVGTALRLGPLVIGSSSIGALIKETKSADVFFGLRFGK